MGAYGLAGQRPPSQMSQRPGEHCPTTAETIAVLYGVAAALRSDCRYVSREAHADTIRHQFLRHHFCQVSRGLHSPVRIVCHHLTSPWPHADGGNRLPVLVEVIVFEVCCCGPFGAGVECRIAQDVSPKIDGADYCDAGAGVLNSATNAQTMIHDGWRIGHQSIIADLDVRRAINCAHKTEVGIQGS